MRGGEEQDRTEREAYPKNIFPNIPQFVGFFGMFTAVLWRRDFEQYL